MVKIKAEDIMIWILIAATIAVALWLLHGSPPESNALISITIFFSTMILLIWKKIFQIDKNTSCSFIKMKNHINKRFDKLEGIIRK